jgi:hypothetical protein
MPPFFLWRRVRGLASVAVDVREFAGSVHVPGLCFPTLAAKNAAKVGHPASQRVCGVSAWVGFVLSHPVDRKKSTGWGTGWRFAGRVSFRTGLL